MATGPVRGSPGPGSHKEGGSPALLSLGSPHGSVDDGRRLNDSGSRHESVSDSLTRGSHPRDDDDDEFVDHLLAKASQALSSAGIFTDENPDGSRRGSDEFFSRPPPQAPTRVSFPASEFDTHQRRHSGPHSSLQLGEAREHGSPLDSRHRSYGGAVGAQVAARERRITEVEATGGRARVSKAYAVLGIGPQRNPPASPPSGTVLSDAEIRRQLEIEGGSHARRTSHPMSTYTRLDSGTNLLSDSPSSGPRTVAHVRGFGPAARSVASSPGGGDHPWLQRAIGSLTSVPEGSHPATLHQPYAVPPPDPTAATRWGYGRQSIASANPMIGEARFAGESDEPIVHQGGVWGPPAQPRSLSAAPMLQVSNVGHTLPRWSFDSPALPDEHDVSALAHEAAHVLEQAATRDSLSGRGSEERPPGRRASLRDEPPVALALPVSVNIIDVGWRSSRNSAAKAYVVYLIEVNCGVRTWTVQRRFREFAALHECLSSAIVSDAGLQGCLDLPVFPSKQILRSVIGGAAALGRERKVLLQGYLWRIVRRPELWAACDELVFFLDDRKRTLAMQVTLRRLLRAVYAVSDILQEAESALAKAKAAPSSLDDQDMENLEQRESAARKERFRLLVRLKAVAEAVATQASLTSGLPLAPEVATPGSSTSASPVNGSDRKLKRSPPSSSKGGEASAALELRPTGEHNPPHDGTGGGATLANASLALRRVVYLVERQRWQLLHPGGEEGEYVPPTNDELRDGGLSATLLLRAARALALKCVADGPGGSEDHPVPLGGSAKPRVASLPKPMPTKGPTPELLEAVEPSSAGRDLMMGVLRMDSASSMFAPYSPMRMLLEACDALADSLVPSWNSRLRRSELTLLAQRLVHEALGAETIAIGASASVSYLPNSPIELSVVVPATLPSSASWFSVLAEHLSRVCATHQRVAKAVARERRKAARQRVNQVGPVEEEEGNEGAAAPLGSSLGQRKEVHDIDEAGSPVGKEGQLVMERLAPAGMSVGVKRSTQLPEFLEGTNGRDSPLAARGTEHSSGADEDSPGAVSTEPWESDEVLFVPDTELPSPVDVPGSPWSPRQSQSKPPSISSPLAHALPVEGRGRDQGSVASSESRREGDLRSLQDSISRPSQGGISALFTRAVHAPDDEREDASDDEDGSRAGSMGKRPSSFTLSTDGAPITLASRGRKGDTGSVRSAVGPSVTEPRVGARSFDSTGMESSPQGLTIFDGASSTATSGGLEAVAADLATLPNWMFARDGHLVVLRNAGFTCANNLFLQGAEDPLEAPRLSDRLEDDERDRSSSMDSSAAGTTATGWTEGQRRRRRRGLPLSSSVQVVSPATEHVLSATSGAAVRFRADNVLVELRANDWHSLALARWSEETDRQLDVAITHMWDAAAVDGRVSATINRKRAAAPKTGVVPPMAVQGSLADDFLPGVGTKPRPHLFKRSYALLRAWLDNEGRLLEREGDPEGTLDPRRGPLFGTQAGCIPGETLMVMIASVLFESIRSARQENDARDERRKARGRTGSVSAPAPPAGGMGLLTHPFQVVTAVCSRFGRGLAKSLLQGKAVVTSQGPVPIATYRSWLRGTADMGGNSPPQPDAWTSHLREFSAGCDLAELRAAEAARSGETSGERPVLPTGVGVPAAAQVRAGIVPEALQAMALGAFVPPAVSAHIALLVESPIAPWRNLVASSTPVTVKSFLAALRGASMRVQQTLLDAERLRAEGVTGASQTGSARSTRHPATARRLKLLRDLFGPRTVDSAPVSEDRRPDLLQHPLQVSARVHYDLFAPDMWRPSSTGAFHLVDPKDDASPRFLTLSGVHPQGTSLHPQTHIPEFPSDHVFHTYRAVALEVREAEVVLEKLEASAPGKVTDEVGLFGPQLAASLQLIRDVKKRVSASLASPDPMQLLDPSLRSLLHYDSPDFASTTVALATAAAMTRGPALALEDRVFGEGFRESAEAALQPEVEEPGAGVSRGKHVSKAKRRPQKKGKAVALNPEADWWKTHEDAGGTGVELFLLSHAAALDSMARGRVARSTLPPSQFETDPMIASDPVLNSDLDLMWIVLTGRLTIGGLFTILYRELRWTGHLSIAQLGKSLRTASGWTHLPDKVKDRVGGLKRFLTRFPTVFEVGVNHPFNPQVCLRDSIGVFLWMSMTPDEATSIGLSGGSSKKKSKSKASKPRPPKPEEEQPAPPPLALRLPNPLPYEGYSAAQPSFGPPPGMERAPRYPPPVSHGYWVPTSYGYPVPPQYYDPRPPPVSAPGSDVIIGASPALHSLQELPVITPQTPLSPVTPLPSSAYTEMRAAVSTGFALPAAVRMAEPPARMVARPPEPPRGGPPAGSVLVHLADGTPVYVDPRALMAAPGAFPRGGQPPPGYTPANEHVRLR
jgi:hypothetical protein